MEQGVFLQHQPVLYQEIIHAIRPRSPGHYIDGTLGAGGHAWGILDVSSPKGELLGLDVDPQALTLAQSRLADFGGRAHIVLSSYAAMADLAHGLGWNQVDGILLDFGVSSMQIDTPGRGFSFQNEGPLDMRFDPSQSLTAANLINESGESDLADLIWKYGGESLSRKIARAICQARPLGTTIRLAEVISRAVRRRSGRIHPATKTFQALRIAVNDELRVIEHVLPIAVELLAPGARLAVIAFHSLEDRMVKQFFRRESRDCVCPPPQPDCNCGHKAVIREVTRHPVIASEEEKKVNPRARSARLRVAEKLELA